MAQPIGVRKSPPILSETDEMLKRIVGINLEGVFYCSREQIRIMMELPTALRSIVNIASITSPVHGGDMYGYGVSKVGVAYLSACLAKDVAPHGVRVNWFHLVS